GFRLPFAGSRVIAGTRAMVPYPGLRAFAHRVDQDLSHLGAGELLRRLLTRSQHLADLRARERDAVLLAVRAGLRRAHPLAPVAPERVLEHERRDAELVRLELLEDLLRVVGAVVRAHAGVVAPDDEIGR